MPNYVVAKTKQWVVGQTITTGSIQGEKSSDSHCLKQLHFFFFKESVKKNKNFTT